MRTGGDRGLFQYATASIDVNDGGREAFEDEANAPLKKCGA
jgi:hypothetical protein